MSINYDVAFYVLRNIYDSDEIKVCKQNIDKLYLLCEINEFDKIYMEFCSDPIYTMDNIYSRLRKYEQQLKEYKQQFIEYNNKLLNDVKNMRLVCRDFVDVLSLNTICKYVDFDWMKSLYIKHIRLNSELSYIYLKEIIINSSFDKYLSNNIWLFRYTSNFENKKYLLYNNEFMIYINTCKLTDENGMIKHYIKYNNCRRLEELCFDMSARSMGICRGRIVDDWSDILYRLRKSDVIIGQYPNNITDSTIISITISNTNSKVNNKNNSFIKTTALLNKKAHKKNRKNKKNKIKNNNFNKKIYTAKYKKRYR